MDIPLLHSCCWCLSLRTGAIIIGVLELFMYILYLVDILIYRLWLPSDPKERFLVLTSDVIFEYAEFLQIIFSSSLIYGAIKENSSFIAAYLLCGLAKIIDGIWNTALITIYFFHLGFLVEELIQIGTNISIHGACVLAGLLIAGLRLLYAIVYNLKTDNSDSDNIN